MTETPASLRHLERRLRAASRSLAATMPFGPDQVAAGLLRRVQFERRRRFNRGTPLCVFGRNGLGPLIAMTVAQASKGGLRNVVR